MQGEFDMQVFETPWRDAIKHSSSGISLDGFPLFATWAGFMLLVPIVMVNILIASMQNSFDAVFAKREAHMLMERAALIMQLESLIHVQHDFAKSAEPETNSHCSKSLWKGAWRIAQVLLTIQIEGSKETSGDYLQVLSNAQSGLHEGVERQALHPPGRVEKMGKKLAGKLDKELNDLKSEVKKC